MDEAKLNVDKLEVTESSVLLLRYHSDMPPEEVQQSLDVLKEEFPDNKILAITDDMKLLESNPDEAVALLERMIAHIKVVGNTKPKIVLT